jgi:hypothetical protein
MESPIVFISSLIEVSHDPLTYTNTRSFFSSQERFDQTLETIHSVRKRIPSARILLVEASSVSTEKEDILKSNVDFYINSSEESIRNICIHSPKKGFGEALQTQIAVDFLLKNKISFSILIKISGRYSLTSEFTLSQYSESEFTFLNPSVQNPNSISTVVYSVPSHLLTVFSNVIKDVIHIYIQVPAVGLEEILPSRCFPRKHIDKIGVEGLVSVTGTYFSC